MRLVIMLFMVVALASCSQDRSTINAAQREGAIRQLPNGEWRIAQFIEDGDDYTRQFENYRLRFTSDGEVTILLPGGGVAATGRWRFFEDDRRTEFELRQLRGDKYEDLNDDWYVRSATASQMRFEDDDSPRQELLVIERIP